MAITGTTLGRAAGLAAVAAGLIFIGVQINHPHLDAGTVTTTDVIVRDSLKVLMAALALAGITGMYLRQVLRTGVLGLIGYLLLAAGYLLILATSFTAAFVLPRIAGTEATFVTDLLTVANGGKSSGDIGALRTVLAVQAGAYLGGGLLFGIALYRARVLARWAAVLLAVGGLVSAALSVMPDAFHRLLALPNGVAMIGLGWSLWLAGPASADAAPASAADPVPADAG
jgi:hypothetical protein